MAVCASGTPLITVGSRPRSLTTPALGLCWTTTGFVTCSEEGVLFWTLHQGKFVSRSGLNGPLVRSVYWVRVSPVWGRADDDGFVAASSSGAAGII